MLEKWSCGEALRQKRNREEHCWHEHTPLLAQGEMRKFKTVADRTVRIFENVENMVEVFKQVSPQKKMLAAQIDTQGARLIG